MVKKNAKIALYHLSYLFSDDILFQVACPEGFYVGYDEKK